jgi:two-component system, OmpR family, clock-associated histidine kinase SasA
MGASSNRSAENVSSPAPVLQLLLFVDKRNAVRGQTEQIRACLERLQESTPLTLEVIDVHEKPFLAEHFKLIATPALVKTFPEPRHVLAGSNLIQQIEECWPQWQQALGSIFSQESEPHSPRGSDLLTHSEKLMQLSDELFRLKQENEALRAQLEFKDRMIKILAHDLRNPLTAATIAIETLEAQWSEQSQAKRKLKPEILVRLIHQAQSQIHNIDRMITHLLESSRGRYANLQIHPKKLDLKQLCWEVIEDVDSTLKVKKQRLKTDIPSDLPLVHADPDQIRQVFMNLIDNATKYTPKGGEIQISIIHRTSQKIQVSISDNGLGIPLEKQKSIFEDNVRLKRDEKQEGYGIGLALCTRIVLAHFGQIWVDSSPNHGSSFHFTLPVYR